MARSVEATFTPSETDHIIRCIDLALQSAHRGQNSKRNTPDFAPVYERMIGELHTLRAKILGLQS